LELVAMSLSPSMVVDELNVPKLLKLVSLMFQLFEDVAACVVTQNVAIDEMSMTIVNIQE
jgi:hypothetical protein